MINEYKIKFMLWIVFSTLFFGCSRTSGTHVGEHTLIHHAFTIPGNGTNPPKIVVKADEWSKKTTEWSDWGIMTNRTTTVETDEAGNVEVASTGIQSESQTEAVASIPKHIIWAWALKNMVEAIFSSLGSVFEAKIDADKVVELEKIDTDGDVRIEEIMDMDMP